MIQPDDASQKGQGDGTSMPLPLAGITVVSIEQAVAAPFAARQLAGLGACMIVVERPSEGDFARGCDEVVLGQACHFVWLNRFKESIELDLKDREDFSLLLRLVRTSDVFVRNPAPSAANRLGLSANQFRDANPRLVHASISGYGTSGPFTYKRAYDPLVQCEAGLVSITGTPDQPSKVGISVADIAAGLYCYAVILTTLFQRERTGAGAEPSVSTQEALGEWVGFPLYYAACGGTATPRTGASHAAIASYGPFRCAGNEQVILGLQNEREWRALCRQVIEDQAIAEHARFCSNSQRVLNTAELTRRIEHTFSCFSTGVIIAQLDEADIANARSRSMHEFFNHSHLRARSRWRDVKTPGGTVLALIPPATLVRQTSVRGPVPRLGEDNASIRAEFEEAGRQE